MGHDTLSEVQADRYREENVFLVELLCTACGHTFVGETFEGETEPCQRCDHDGCVRA